MSDDLPDELRDGPSDDRPLKVAEFFCGAPDGDGRRHMLLMAPATASLDDKAVRVEIAKGIKWSAGGSASGGSTADLICPKHGPGCIVRPAEADAVWRAWTSNRKGAVAKIWTRDG